jgi:hypothetical protein
MAPTSPSDSLELSLPENSLSSQSSTSTDWKLMATQHPDFWFRDGSIVLYVDKTLFRVHQTILAKHSEVFNDLFTLPQPTAEEEETVDGCRVVMLHDSKEDFVDLLNAIYDPSYANAILFSIVVTESDTATSTICPPTRTWDRCSCLLVAFSALAPNTSSALSVNDVSLCYQQNFRSPSWTTSQNQTEILPRNTIPIRSCELLFLLWTTTYPKYSHIFITA